MTPPQVQHTRFNPFTAIIPRKKLLSFRSKFLLFIFLIGILAYNHETLEFYFYYRSQCLASAVDVGGGEKLALCGWKVLDDMPDAPDIRAFVYDTSDQLLLPENKRSAEWMRTAGNIGLRAAFINKMNLNKKTLIDKDKFSKIIPMGNHFYRVNL